MKSKNNKIEKRDISNLVQYNESSYFEDKEVVVMYVPAMKRFWIVKPMLYNGAWYGGNYKLTSVLTCDWKDIYHIDVHNDMGIVTKYLEDDTIGVNWKQGTKPLPMFWNNINWLFEVKC